MKPIIDKEFFNLFPIPSKAERAGLFASIEKYGVKQAIVVWEEQNIILDGHTRYGIAEELGIECPIEYMQFPSRHAAKEWILHNQLDRRNLTDEKKKFFIGTLMAMEKQPRPPQPGEKRTDTVAVPPENAAKKIAEQAGVSERTVYRSAKFSIAINLIGSVNPSLKNAILNGKSSMNEAEIIASAPLSCERCWRLGPPPPKSPCPQCTLLRSGKRPPKPKPAKVEKPEVAVVDSILGRLKAIDKAVKELVVGKFGDQLKKLARPLDLGIRTEKVARSSMKDKEQILIEWPVLVRLLELFEKLKKEVQ